MINYQIMWIKFGLFAVFLINITYGYRLNPLKDPLICGRPQCDENSNNKFKYETAKLYRYEYSMHVKSEFAGSGDNTSDLYMQAFIDLTFPKPCEGLLKISNVRLKDNNNFFTESSKNDDLHPKSNDLANDIRKQDLRFAFYDGLISEVCPHTYDNIWVLNFKKGLLSALQNTMDRFDIDHNTTETDVSGTCNVFYQLTKSEGTGLLIQKIKDIPSCTHRSQTQSILQTTPYNFRQNYAAWPIVKSTSYCNILIDHFVYKEVSCHENHQLVPFSNQESGAVTQSSFKLTLIKEENITVINIDEVVQYRTTLLFDHTPSPRPATGEIKASRELLKQMCKLGFPDIQRDFPDVFTKFLSTAKLLSHTTLQQLLARASSICGNGKNHVLESLPYIGSTAAVFMMRDQIVKGAIPLQVMQSWITTLALIPRPDEKMLEAAFTLLEFGITQKSPEYILTPTAMAHTFCKQNPDCSGKSIIKKIANFLETEADLILYHGIYEREQRERLIILLKGLANIGVMSKPFIYELKNLITSEMIPLDIKLQSIYAHRRLDCENTRDFFMDMYRNTTEDTEIRIASYLQLMHCPDYSSIKHIKHVLKHEVVNQVGSFIWSHLTNLAKSSSPVNVAVQGLLMDTDLETKYNMDLRQFSRNYERTLFFDEYNFGSSADGNVIFGTDSYLPKTATLNLTAHLFGESVNLLELSARADGFENYIESLFGPRGPLSSEKFKEKFSYFTKYFKDTANSVENEVSNLDKFRIYKNSESGELRNKREINVAETAKNDLENSVDKLGYNLKRKNSIPTAAFGMKVFGNDLKYFTLESFPEVVAAAKNLDPVNYLVEILSGKEVTYSKSGIFLDLAYTVPLSSGLPLSISALGSSSIDLRMSGSLIAPEFLETKKIDVEGKLKPSISLDVLATMQTDFFHATSAIRVRSNLYSSSAIEAKLKIRGSKLISLQFSLPQDQNEIFSARSELLVLKENIEIPQKGIGLRYTNATCSWPAIVSAIGLNFCAEYSLPDVSNKTVIYPSLILSGPINFDVRLDKADLTAKVFLFEYREERSKLGTYGSLVFETPGTIIPRKFITNITRNNEVYNLTMSFVNGTQFYSAFGTYRHTKNENKFELGFTSEGQKKFALEMGVNITDIKNGWLYQPLFIMSIREERIAGMTGTVKVTEKKGIQQHEVNLLFETKKLQTKLTGYVVYTESSIAVKLGINYLFFGTKPENVQIEGELANRSKKTRTEYQGVLKLQSTAYPKLNFAANMQFLIALGHIECKVGVNNAPDLIDPDHTLTVRLVFARFYQSEQGRTTSSLEVTRPKSNIDLKFYIKHDERYKSGFEHNFLVIVRYAPNKEVNSVLSVLLPHGHYFAVDTAFNITIPSFDSCTFAFKINETSAKEYNVEFVGAWFSGHSITIKGLYQDRSSAVKKYHHLKLNVQSPSFEDTTLDMRYSRDDFEFKLDFQIDHAKQPYGLTLKYLEHTKDTTISSIEFRWQNRLYSASLNIQTQQPKQLILEIHLDKLRDIHLLIKGLNNQGEKEIALELKWDANRDPSQKLVLSAEYYNPEIKTYSGGFLISYPDRTFSGNFDIDTKSSDKKGNARISWSAQETVDIKFLTSTKLTPAKDMWLWAKIDTPFDGWRHNSINGGFYYLDNLLLVNGSLLWAEEQHVGFEILGDYEINVPLFRCEFKTAINSTIIDVPSISAHIKHRHDNKKIITLIILKHFAMNEISQTISLQSGWEFDNSIKYRNVSGFVHLRTPFTGYKNGVFVTKFSLSDKRELKGVADLEIEDKRYTLAVDGHIKKLTDNMLVANITTPIEKFRNIICRFGINEQRKHIVAEVRAPTGALGVEILLDIMSHHDFDVIFNLETPLDAFEKVMLIAKMKQDEIDFRGAWNKVLLGFIGVWRMNNIKDFEYSYKVLTPLKNFENNGVVLKCLISDHVDLEISFKLAKYKLGVKMLQTLKPKVLQELGFRKTIDQLSDFIEDDDDDDIEEPEEPCEEYCDEQLEVDPGNFIGYIELDTIVWPTIKGNVDYEMNGDYYYMFGNVELPKGNVEFRNKFYYPHYFLIKNSLRVKTPYVSMKEIKSTLISKINMGQLYIIGMDVTVLNNNEWVTAGYRVNYSSTVDAEFKAHNMEIHLLTPLKKLPKIEIKGSLESEESTYRGNISVRTHNTQISVAGSLESEENFVDISLGLLLRSPIVPQYACQVFFKKELSEMDNSISLGFELQNNQTISVFRGETIWHEDSKQFLNIKGKINTNLLPITAIDTSVHLTRFPYPIASFEFNYNDLNGRTTETMFRTTRKDSVVTMEIKTPMNDFRNVSFTGDLIPKDKDTYTCRGNLYRNSELYSVEGTIVISSDIPMNVDLTFQPATGGIPGTIKYFLRNTDGDLGKTYQIRIERGSRVARVGGGILYKNKFNWDFVVSVVSSEPEISRININATIKPDEIDGIISQFDVKTPWKNLGIESFYLETKSKITTEYGKVVSAYQLPTISGNGKVAWSWILHENMQINLENYAQIAGISGRSLKTELIYKNPNQNMQNMVLGSVINVDSLWKINATGMFRCNSLTDFDAGAILELPEPTGDIHRINAIIRTDIDNILDDINFDINYSAVESKNHYGAKGQLRNSTHLQGVLRVEWGPNIQNDSIEGNINMLRNGMRRELSGSLLTPYYIEDTLKVNGNYDRDSFYHNIVGTIYYPASRQMLDTNVHFATLTNTNGMINCTTPFLNTTWIRGDFDFSTKSKDSVRYVKATWPENTAIFDSKSTYTSVNLDYDIKGTVYIEAPLTTRHFANIVYNLKERPLLTTGKTKIEYNQRNVLNGNYIRKSEQRAGYQKDVVDITIENEMKPIGIHYIFIHQSDQQSPDYKMNRAEIFELKNSATFNITSEFHVTTSETGVDYKIVAIHPNRTVILTSNYDYDYQEQITKQNSKLELGPNIWLGYNFKIQNLTKFDKESQVLSLQLSYPNREISADGMYAITQNQFDSELAFKWIKSSDDDYGEDPESRVMQAALRWRDEPVNDSDTIHQTLALTMQHPSFEQDLTIDGFIYRSPIDLIKSKLYIAYCAEPEHLVTFGLDVEDHTTVMGYKNLTFNIYGSHEISDFDLSVNGSIFLSPGLYQTHNIGSYKRGYIPFQEGLLFAYYNAKKGEIEFCQELPSNIFKIWGCADGSFPLYTANGTMVDTPEIDGAAEFYLNIDEKLIRFEANYTPYGNQRIQMLGSVPDARSSSFEFWRIYDDIKVVDISYYAKMNHSRLVTSKVMWRPEIKSDVKARIKQLAANFYESISENVDYWVKTIYSESLETINDVWQNAKPYTQPLLDDVAGLRILEDDIEEFRLFLNQSYHANDFYIRSVINFTLTIIDEMAIRNHIESVPKIITEIWQVMGDSGQALRKSVIWLIETIKTSYQKAVEMISRIFHGESIEHVGTLLETAVQKYDKFIKELHLSFIKYVENMYTRITEMITAYWKRMLQNIGPSILKLSYYLESIIFSISKEIFDFMYERTNELVESPYFDQVSNFTHDLDMLYKDIVGNDIITNIRKYSVIIYNFVKDKYYKFVPFGKELNDLITELWDEIRTLEKLEFVQSMIQKAEETQARIAWLAEEFQFEKRIQQVLSMLRNKLFRFAQTALEADNKYREAKTKFIFDLNNGIMMLEQKLPMSWHAFNETPKFEEIREYKLLTDGMDFFAGSNTSMWTIYNKLMPYTDVNIWLPPYRSHALIISSRHYMTFDKKFVSLNLLYQKIHEEKKPDQCSYLLAHDFLDENFTLALEPSILRHKDDLIATRKISLIANNELLDIDVVGDAIRIGRNLTTALPAKIGDTIIYRDADILTVESINGFHLSCNIQFDLCSFDLSGWHFGKTAGILGTMNNEAYDDFTTSSNKFAMSESEFINSWTLPNCQHPATAYNSSLIASEASIDIHRFCEQFFKSKISYFSSCFGIVNPLPFFDMCLDLGVNSISLLVESKHPAQKGACTAALAYIEVCEIENTPLRVPDVCVHCDLVNGSYVPEGTFIIMQDDDIPLTSEIIFIIEAKECNENITTTKNLMSIATALNKEFNEANFTNNRYSVVAFGGVAPFNVARSIVVNNEVFTDYNNLPSYFNHIKTAPSNNSDIFQAISIASKLIFRPGASKTFILVPCSECNSSNMRLDYSSLLQLLLEYSINLHILMDQDFIFDKARANRLFFGMDREHAFTKKDFKILKGDEELFKQVRLPKASLGVCYPLAIETNGSVFSARKLKAEKKNPIKKFATVFAKRVVKSAIPNSCQNCECTGHNTGVAYMTCFPCSYPNTGADFDFDEDLLPDTQGGTDWEVDDNDDE